MAGMFDSWQKRSEKSVKNYNAYLIRVNLNKFQWPFDWISTSSKRISIAKTTFKIRVLKFCPVRANRRVWSNFFFWFERLFKRNRTFFLIKGVRNHLLVEWSQKNAYRLSSQHFEAGHFFDKKRHYFFFIRSFSRKEFPTSLFLNFKH